MQRRNEREEQRKHLLGRVRKKGEEMSSLIRKYRGRSLGKGKDELNVTAYVGGVQFTIGGKYCALSGTQVKDLIFALQARLDGRFGFTATGIEIFPEDEPIEVESGEK